MFIQNVFSQDIMYNCSNKKVDEDASYYLSSYLLTFNSEKKEALFKDSTGEIVSDGTISLKKISSPERRLVGGLKGTIWSDGGCRVEAFLTKEMLAGSKKASMRVKQGAECENTAVWYVCLKLN